MNAEPYSPVAEEYRRVLDPMLAPFAERMVELAQVEAGACVLDVACGTGGVARAAHARGARVLGVDASERMVEVARATSPSAIEFAVAHADRLPVQDGSYDVVTCGFALSHMTGLAAVLAEIRRVGRRFVASAWGSGGWNPAAEAVRRTLGHGWLAVDERRWADPERGALALAEAGFRVEVATMRLSGRFADAEEAVAWALAWPGPVVDDRGPLVAAAAAAGLDWRYTVNYFVAV